MGMNEETPNPELPVEAQAEGEPQASEPQPQDVDESPQQDAGEAPQREVNEPPPRDPRRRLRELLAIPDRDRPDALWDELIELEIQLAPGNRVQPQQGEGGMRRQEPGRRPDQGQRQDSGRRPEQAQQRQEPGGAKPKRFFKKPKRGPGAPPKPSNS